MAQMAPAVYVICVVEFLPKREKNNQNLLFLQKCLHLRVTKPLKKTMKSVTTPSTYESTVAYLYEQLPVFQKVGKAAYKKDLGNTKALMEVLDQPHQKFKSIHIAGTNGKGSCAHMLAAIFQEHGYKTGLYTSPHLIDFRERIKIDGEEVSTEFVVDFVERVKPHIEKIEPSFFEITVAMAFAYFAQKGVDMAIIETGMGGRLDSTNILRPELSIITNVALDHQIYLGDTYEAIATEKAGIIKNEVPVILGKMETSAAAVIKQSAKKHKSPIYTSGTFFKTFPLDIDTQNKHFKVKVKRLFCSGENRVYFLDLIGRYQVENLGTVLTAVELLKNAFDFETEKVAHALSRVRELTNLRGRWEVVGKKPMMVADIAHNEAALKWQQQNLSNHHYRKLHLIFGCSSDKKPEDFFGLFPKDAQLYLCQSNVMRAYDVADLAEKAGSFFPDLEKFSTVEAAVSKAQSAAQSEDLILITGSAFVVAEALSVLPQENEG